MNFLEYVVKQQNISDTDAKNIRQKANGSDLSLDKALREYGISSEELLRLKEEYYAVSACSIDKNKEVAKGVLDYIPEESAAHYQIAPLGVESGRLQVGAINPDSVEVRDALNFISSKTELPYDLCVITDEGFKIILDQYGGLSGEVTEALSELEEELTPSEKDKKSSPASHVSKDKTSNLSEDGEIKVSDTIQTKEESTIVEDAPVTKIVATILRYATEGKASDVHIEQMRENVRVRFRVDGTLNTSLMLPSKVHSAVVARVKILSNMRLDEKRKPQDGRFSAKIEGRRIDFRVSTFPSYYGEKIVMRILDQEQGVRSIEELDLREPHKKMIQDAISAPFGMILISGPTGSGKTTTLYSMLDLLDKEGKNILSLEDPVEYNIEGVSQSQIRPDIGYTFANGLRTALRQDPDIIMVGEIRDKETAQLAIHAALTGHLVLSTIHTNNAIGIIPRLIDMGVDPYLIAPTLLIGIAQRLVAGLCPDAAESKPIEGSIRAMIDDQFHDLSEDQRQKIMPDSDKVYEAGSSADCPTGTKGRKAVMEILDMSKELEQVILTNPSENAIYEVVRRQGMIQMKEDAIIKSMQKKIPFKEVNTL